MGLGETIHAALIREVYQGKLIGHVSRDSTQIDGREKPTKKPDTAPDEGPTKKRGRPKKGEQRPQKEPTRIERQMTQNLADMVADLPTECDVGGKENSQGNPEWWVGYKLHFDVFGARCFWA